MTVYRITLNTVISLHPVKLHIGTSRREGPITHINSDLLTLNLPTTTIVAQPFNVIKWQLKFNPAI